MFFPDSVLEVCDFLTICPFLLDCPFDWHTVLYSNLVWSFVFLWCLLQFLSFIILLIWIISFLFLMVWKKVYQFFYPLKEPEFRIFAVVYFISILFISVLIFISSFLLLTLGFVCYSFSSCFKCKNTIVYLRFFLFPEVKLYCYKFPS